MDDSFLYILLKRCEDGEFLSFTEEFELENKKLIVKDSENEVFPFIHTTLQITDEGRYFKERFEKRTTYFFSSSQQFIIELFISAARNANARRFVQMI